MACAQRSSTFFQFFRIILQRDLENGEIRLPNKFTSKYEEGLSNPALLKVPDGTKWKLHWEKRDGGISFARGWKEFVQQYSLRHGHLLVFKYLVSSSHFEVTIFDMSTAEIDYKPNQQKMHLDVKAEDDDDEVTKFEMKTNAVPSRARQQVQVPRAGALRSKNPPTFKVRMSESYAKGRCIALPKGFAKKYLKEGPIRLNVGKRSWMLKFKISNTKYKIQNGWGTFSRENRLKKGDVCDFVLTNSKEVTLNVQINRAAN